MQSGNYPSTAIFFRERFGQTTKNSTKKEVTWLINKPSTPLYNVTASSTWLVNGRPLGALLCEIARASQY
jgi:hypothetical protein